MQNEFNNYAIKHKGISSLHLEHFQKINSQATNGLNFNAAVPMSTTPHVVEERPMNMAIMSVFDRLMMDRIIFLGTAIDDTVANIINAQLLFLESLDKDAPVTIYLNSPGGSVYAGLGIYDVMNFIKPGINTVNTGLAASMAAVLLTAGKKGGRSALRHSRTMIHQPLGGASGQASDIEITAREIKKLKSELFAIIAKHSGATIKKVEKDGDRDFWLTAEEAVKYGLIDTIL